MALAMMIKEAELLWSLLLEVSNEVRVLSLTKR